MGYEIQIGKKYISRADLIEVLSIDKEDFTVLCLIIKELDPNQGIPEGHTFNMHITGFINQYNIYLDWDKEIEEL